MTEETGVGKIIPLCLTLNVRYTKIKVVGQINAISMLFYLPKILVPVKMMGKGIVHLLAMVNLKVLAKTEFVTRNSDAPMSAVPPADMFCTQFLLRSSLILSSH